MNDSKNKDGFEEIMRYINTTLELVRDVFKGDQRFDLWGAIFNFATIIILTGAVVLLAILNLIDSTVTATLLGGIIGYTLGQSQSYLSTKGKKR